MIGVTKGEACFQRRVAPLKRFDPGDQIERRTPERKRRPAGCVPSPLTASMLRINPAKAGIQSCMR
jgi:hypothetical protein